MAVSLVAIIVMLPFALDREPPESDSSSRATGTGGSPATDESAPATATPARTSTPADVDAAEVLVIGDVDTGGFSAGSVGWPAVVEERLRGVELTVATTGNAGYVTTEAESDATFPELLEVADLDGVDVVVLFGSRFDAAGIADEVNLAAGVAIGALAERAPSAELVVVGPAWPAGAAPAGVRNNRDVLRSAAQTAGAVFIDPLADGWLSDAPGLLGPDGMHLTAAADAYLADRMEPLIRSALDA